MSIQITLDEMATTSPSKSRNHSNTPKENELSDDSIPEPAETTDSPHLVAAAYIRPATSANLSDDIREVVRYMRDELGLSWLGPNAVSTATDHLDGGEETHVSISPHGGREAVVIAADIAVTDDESQQDPDGLRTLLEGIPSHPHIEAIVSPSADQMLHHERDVHEFRDIAMEHGLELHLFQQGVAIIDVDEVPNSLLVELATLEQTDDSDIDGRKGRLRPAGGRPPIGFSSEDGILVEGDDYERVRKTLKAVDEDRMSQRAAAEELDCARKTIRNALDHPDRYNL